jgi:hypothetical protein
MPTGDPGHDRVAVSGALPGLVLGAIVAYSIAALRSDG